jgi:hypothetical protein
LFDYEDENENEDENEDEDDYEDKAEKADSTGPSALRGAISFQPAPLSG